MDINKVCQYFNSPFVIMVLSPSRKTFFQNYIREFFLMNKRPRLFPQYTWRGEQRFLECSGPSHNRKTILQPLQLWMPPQNTNWSFITHAKKKWKLHKQTNSFLGSLSDQSRMGMSEYWSQIYITEFKLQGSLGIWVLTPFGGVLTSYAFLLCSRWLLKF